VILRPTGVVIVLRPTVCERVFFSVKSVESRMGGRLPNVASSFLIPVIPYGRAIE
jgi:hypothetical protein